MCLMFRYVQRLKKAVYNLDMNVDNTFVTGHARVAAKPVQWTSKYIINSLILLFCCVNV